MKLLQTNLQPDHNIIFFGDAHHGAVLSSKSGWEMLCDMLNSEYEGCKNNYCIETGDMIEAIMVDDKRFSPEMLKQNGNEPLPLVQMKYAIEKRKAIASHYLCMLQGNHDRKLWRFGDIAAEMCRELNVPYGAYTSKIAIKDKKENLMYKNYVTHGFKNITSTADDPKRRRVNMQLILKRHLKFKAGDCVVMVKAHTHKLIVCKPESELYLTDDGQKIKQGYTSWGQNEQYIHPDARWYGSSGSLLRLYGKDMSGYAEIQEYDPTELGWLCLIVRNRKIVELRPVYLKNISGG